MNHDYIKAILLAILLCVFTTACSSANKVNLVDASIAVIETSTFKPESYLKLYKADGTFLRQETISCQDINSAWAKPTQKASRIIMNTGGGYSNRSDKIVDIDLKNNTYTLNPITTGILANEAAGSFIYATDCPVGGSVIYEFDVEKRKVVFQKQVNGTVSHLKIANDSMFAFADDSIPDNENTLSIYRMDSKSLEIQKKVQLPNSYCVKDSFQIGNNLYFAPSSLNIDGDAPDSIYRMDIETMEIAKIPFTLKGPFCMTELKGKLYISSKEIESAEDSIVSVFNPTSRKFEESSVCIHEVVNQMEAQGKYIYIYAQSELITLDAATLKTVGSIKLGVTRDKYRNQGFFLIPENSK